MELTPKQQNIVRAALALYRSKMKKMMKDSESLRAGEPEIKKMFLEAEALSVKFTEEE